MKMAYPVMSTHNPPRTILGAAVLHHGAIRWLGHHAVFFICAMIVAFCLTPAPPASAQKTAVIITPGIGHDRFSEIFFLDSASLSPDSLERIRKTLTDFEETYGSLGLGMESGRWRLENTVYATKSLWRDIALGRGRWTSGRWRADFNGRFEWKGRDTKDTSLSSYTYARLELAPRRQINDQIAVLAPVDWEVTDYHRNTSYTYDYSRLRGQAGFEYLGEKFQSLELRLGLLRRHVPGSLSLGYDERFARLDAAGWQFGRWRLESEFSLADRDYDSTGGQDDFTRWVMLSRADLDLSPTWRLSAVASWQSWKYRHPDDLHFDVRDVRFEPSVRVTLHEVWELGGTLEWRLEQAIQDSFAFNNYKQWSAGPRVAWNPGAILWTEVFPRLGSRDYASASPVYDDYSFWEITWHADLAMRQGPTASATIAYSSERHTDRSRDAAYTYVSVAMRFPIRL